MTEISQAKHDELMARLQAAVEDTFTVVPDAVARHPVLSVKVTVGPGTATATWEVTDDGGSPIAGFKAGRDGYDTDDAPAWEAVLAATAASQTFDKLKPGTTYVFDVTAVNAAGLATLVEVQAVIPGPVTPGPGPSPTRRVPLIGKSGLGFNSIIFSGGSPSMATLAAKGAARGRPYDGLMWFITRENWGDYRKNWGDAKAVLDSGHLLVTRLPHAPQGLGKGVNAAGAADDYADEQRAFGGWLAAQGLNTPNHVLSLDWECNGDWYNWSAANGGAPALRAAYRNCVTNLRAGGAGVVRFDLCFNKGPSQARHDFDIFPGAAYCDSITVDFYDQWGPSFTDAQWEAQLAKSPSPRTVRDWVRANAPGVMHGLSEGGTTHPKDANHGGDNPFYWQKIAEFYLDPANQADCSWHVTYDHAGAPPSLRHDFASNPKSWAAYETLFGGN